MKKLTCKKHENYLAILNQSVIQFQKSDKNVLECDISSRFNKV